MQESNVDLWPGPDVEQDQHQELKHLQDQDEDEDQAYIDLVRSVHGSKVHISCALPAYTL